MAVSWLDPAKVLMVAVIRAETATFLLCDSCVDIADGECVPALVYVIHVRCRRK